MQQKFNYKHLIFHEKSVQTLQYTKYAARFLMLKRLKGQLNYFSFLYD